MAVIVRPLSSVSSLVRFAEEPQMFAPIHVYASTSRDSLLAAVRDVLQAEVGICIGRQEWRKNLADATKEMELLKEKLAAVELGQEEANSLFNIVTMITSMTWLFSVLDDTQKSNHVAEQMQSQVAHQIGL